MRRITVLLVGIFMAFSVKAQSIVLKCGSLSFLKNEKFVMVHYDYSNMGVGKFDKEEDYVAKKVSDYNAKEAGKGDRWKESWIADRKASFQPKFEELLNKQLKSAGVYFGPENKDAKYTLIVKTTFTEPGYNIYVTRKSASVDVEAVFVETANPSNMVAVIISKRNPGTSFGGNDYDSGVRISEAYAKCGKEIGKFIVKNISK